MSQLNISITANTSDFNQFADELGYNAEVITIVNNVQVASPNPQTKLEFIQAQFKAMTIAWLAAKKIAIIDQQIMDQRTAEKDAMRAAITSAVAVNFV